MDNEMMKLVRAYLGNTKDKGGKGRAVEVITRTILSVAVERCHPQGVADISKKCKGAVEVKTACGWLVNPCYESKEEALEEIADGLPNFRHARYVAYAPEVFLTESMSPEKAILAVYAAMKVYTKREFLACVRDAGLFVAKKSSAGLWGVAIQSFKNSMKREALWFSLLQNHGEDLFTFAEKWKG